MKNKTKITKYLNVVKRRAERLAVYDKYIKEHNIDILDEGYESYRLRKEMIPIASDIHYYGFKYRLAVSMKPYYINE